MAENLKQKTITGVIWSFIEQSLSKGIGFVIGIILARLLTPDDYGLVGMLGLFLGLSAVFIDGGLANALVQCQKRTEEDYSTVFYINLAMSVAIYLILFLCAPLIARFYDQPILTKITRILSLSLILGALSSVAGTMLTIKVDFKTITYISISKSVLTGIITIICAYKGMGVWALVVQGLMTALLSTVITTAFVRWYPRTGFSKESFHKLFSYGSKLLLARIISNIYDNIYTFVIGKRVSAAAVGQYTRAGQYPALGCGLIIGMINRVAFPVLSRIQDDDERLLRVYDKYIQISSFLIFPVAMGICGCARPLVILLLTEKWKECIPLMQILCFSSMFVGITMINLNLLYVKGRSDLVLRLEIIKKCIAFAIVFITAFFNVKIMCYGQVAYSIIAVILNTTYTKKLLNYGFWKQVKTILPYLIISLAIMAEALLICHLIANDWIALSLSVAVCALTYFSAHAIIKSYAFTEAKTFLHDLIHRHSAV